MSKQSDPFSWDQSFHREVEVKDASEMKFVRESASGQWIPHTAETCETRFIQITQRSTEDHAGAEVNVLELENGNKVLINAAGPSTMVKSIPSATILAPETDEKTGKPKKGGKLVPVAVGQDQGNDVSERQ